jgi:hypothetical protein
MLLDVGSERNVLDAKYVVGCSVATDCVGW